MVEIDFNLLFFTISKERALLFVHLACTIRLPNFSGLITSTSSLSSSTIVNILFKTFQEQRNNSNTCTGFALMAAILSKWLSMALSIFMMMCSLDANPFCSLWHQLLPQLLSIFFNICLWCFHLCHVRAIGGDTSEVRHILCQQPRIYNPCKLHYITWNVAKNRGGTKRVTLVQIFDKYSKWKQIWAKHIEAMLWAFAAYLWKKGSRSSKKDEYFLPVCTFFCIKIRIVKICWWNSKCFR